jgi:hypothetical protein
MPSAQPDHARITPPRRAVSRCPPWLRALQGSVGVVATLACQRTSGVAEVVGLSPAIATHPEGFSQVTSVTELSDGSVLVSDPREGAIFALSRDLRVRRQVGERGQGPLSYVNAVALMQYHADSAFQIDGLARRWLVFSRQQIVGQLPPDAPWVVSDAYTAGADSLGNVLQVRMARMTPQGGTVSEADSADMVLVNRISRRAERVGRLRPPSPYAPGKDVQAYFESEQAFLGIDGWLAVVRVRPYRVDWRSPGGEWSYGPPLVPGELPFTDAEKDFYLSVSRAGRSGSEREVGIQWPDKIPAVGFHAPRATLTWEGELVLRRQRTVGVEGGVHDVIDRHGKLAARIQISPDSRIVGFGRSSVYVVTTDDDGLQFLSRHPWVDWSGP